MSDLLESIFDDLRGQQPPSPFAPAEAVRRRARQRTRRQVALAGVAVLAVTGLGAGTVAFAVAGQPAFPPAATPPATGAPAPTSIPGQWLLSAGDLGPGDWRRDEWEPEWTEGPDRWRWGGGCAGYVSEDYPTLRQRLEQRTVFWSDGPWDPADPPPWVHQVVDLLEPGAGVGHLRDIRAALAECDERRGLRDLITETGFAGDESMMIREEFDLLSWNGDPFVRHSVVVRVGDAVVTIASIHPSDYSPGAGDPDRLRELARRAADRLR